MILIKYHQFLHTKNRIYSTNTDLVGKIKVDYLIKTVGKRTGAIHKTNNEEENYNFVKTAMNKVSDSLFGATVYCIDSNLKPWLLTKWSTFFSFSEANTEQVI